MSRAEPLITPEELQCLLGGAPARSNSKASALGQATPLLQFGSALWLAKGVFLYAVLTNPEAAQLVDSSRYLWMRGCLELACLAAFAVGAVHPRGRSLASASLLVASTTWLLDAMTLLAFAG